MAISSVLSPIATISFTVLVGIACSDDALSNDPSVGGGSGGGEITNTGGANASGGASAGQDGETSSGGSDAGGGNPGGASSGGSVAMSGGSASGGDGTLGSGGDSNGTGGSVSTYAYQFCDQHLGEADNPACEPGTICRNGYCTGPCENDLLEGVWGKGLDCPAAETGNALPNCRFGYCTLHCPDDRTCPHGLVCQSPQDCMNPEVLDP